MEPADWNKKVNIYADFLKAINRKVMDDDILKLIKQFKYDFGISTNNLNKERKSIWIEYFKKYN